MAITIQGGKDAPGRVVLEQNGQPAEITEAGALKVDATHTVQPISGQVEVVNSVSIAHPVTTKELNTAREITALPAVKIDPVQNTVKAIIDEPVKVQHDGEIISRIANASLPVKGQVEVTNLPLPLNSLETAVMVEGKMQVANLPSVQEVAGAVTVEQPIGRNLNASVKVTNLPLPVVNYDQMPLVVDGQVELKPTMNHIGSVDIASLPAVQLSNVAKDTAGHLQVDIVSQPEVRIGQVRLDPLWSTVQVSNFPDIQTVNLANKIVELSSETQANLKQVDARITNSVITVKDISDNKQVAVTNWPSQLNVAGTVDLPFNTIQDLKVVQVDNFPAVQNVAIPAAHLDSLGRWMVKVDKMPPVKIDDSVPIKVDTELTIDNATVTLGNVDTIGEVRTLGSITSPVPVDDSTPIKVDVIGIDQVTFTNSSLNTYEQNAYDSINDRFKVVVEEEPTTIRNVTIVGQPLDTNVLNLPVVQTVKATSFDVRPLNHIIDSVSAHIENPVLHVDDNNGSLTVDGAVDVINFPSVYPVTNDGKPLDIKGHVTTQITSAPTLEVTPDPFGTPFPVVADALDIRKLSAATDAISIEGGNTSPVVVTGELNVGNLPDNQAVTVTNVAVDADNHIQADIASLPAVALTAESLQALEHITASVDNLPALQDVNVTNQMLLDAEGHGQVDILSLPQITLDATTLAALEHISVDNLPDNQDVTVTNLVFNEFGALETSITDLPAVALDANTLSALEHITVLVDNMPVVQDVNLVNQMLIDTAGHGQVDVLTLPDVKLDTGTLESLEHVTATVDNFPANQDVTVTNIAVDLDNHQQIDIVHMPSLPAGINKIGSVDAQITNPVIDVQGTVALDAETLAELENTTVTIDNLPAIQDVRVVNQIAKDPLTGRAKVDIVDMPSLPMGDNTIGRVHNLGFDYDSENPAFNEIRVNNYGEQYVEVTNLPLIQDVALTNVSQDIEGRVDVNVHEMPIVKIDDTIPIKVDTELTVENAVVTLDNIQNIQTIGSLASITNPVPIDDSTPIKVDVVGVDTVTIQSGTLNTHEQNAYDAETDRMKVQIESEPGVRDVNVINTVLPIAGVVQVENFPSVQEVSANGLDIRALNAAQDSITATIDNSLLSVQVANLPSVQTVAGTVNIGSLPAIKFDQTANSVNVLSLPALPSGDNVIGRLKTIGFNYDDTYPDYNEIRVNGTGEQFVQVTNLPKLQQVEITNSVALDADKHAQIDVVTLPDVKGTVSVNNIPSHYDVTVDNQIAIDPLTNRAQVDIVGSIPVGGNHIGHVTVDEIPAISGEVEVTNFPLVQQVELVNPEARDPEGHPQVDIVTLPSVTGDVSINNIPTHFDVTVGNQVARDIDTNRAQVDIVNPLPAGSNLIGTVNVSNMPTVSGTISIDNFPEIQQVELTNPEARDAEGHAQVHVVNVPTVHVDNADFGVRDIQNTKDNIQIYGNDGINNRPVKTDENGRLQVIAQQPRDSFDYYFEDTVHRSETRVFDIVIPNGETWTLTEFGITVVPDRKPDWHPNKMSGDARIIWDPDTEETLLRRLGGGALGGTNTSSMQRELVGDGIKKVRVVIANRGAEPLLIGAWLNGYVN